jgi:20S proteasome alpha/beta subunit
MTLGIILFGKEDSIVIVSDKRVTTSTAAMSAHGDSVQKIHKVNDHCGLTIAGDGGIAASIVELFLKEIATKGSDVTVSEAAEIFRQTAIQNYDKWFGLMTLDKWVENVMNKSLPFFTILIAGFDKDADGNLSERKLFELNTYRKFAPQTISNNFGIIGITTISQYLLYRFYKAPDKDIDITAGIAALCIQETNSQDDSVGNEFQIATFSKNEPFQFYSEEKLLQVTQRCAELKNDIETSLLNIKIKEQP